MKNDSPEILLKQLEIVRMLDKKGLLRVNVVETTQQKIMDKLLNKTETDLLLEIDDISMRFDIGLSFPGERRPFVEEVANILCDKIGKPNVFYDRHFEAELARPDLDIYLQDIYHRQCKLLIVFVCESYEEKEWCGIEWRAIRDLIKQKKDASIMPFRFDETHIPGLFSIDGYVHIKDRKPLDIATIILERLDLLKSTSKY